MARRVPYTLWSVRCGEPWLVATRRSLVELEHIGGFVSESYGVPCWILSLDRDDPEVNKRSLVELLGLMGEHLAPGFVADLPAIRAAFAAEAGSE